MPDDIKVDDVVTFHERVFQPPYTPHYDRYKGHLFVVTEFHFERDACHDHVWVDCVSDPSIVIAGYVHTTDLEKVNGH